MLSFSFIVVLMNFLIKEKKMSEKINTEEVRNGCRWKCLKSDSEIFIFFFWIYLEYLKDLTNETENPESQKLHDYNNTFSSTKRKI